ncbi:MAG: hypothetical protein IJ088_06330, partial [Clostridia bacterium]|nr:hypothetical protein [Clostridia bacterium]
ERLSGNALYVDYSSSFFFLEQPPSLISIGFLFYTGRMVPLATFANVERAFDDRHTAPPLRAFNKRSTEPQIR